MPVLAPLDPPDPALCERGQASARGDFNFGTVQMMGSLMERLIQRHAEPALARGWSGRLLRGEALIGLAITEPRGGADAAHLQLQARACDGGYRLAGEKPPSPTATSSSCPPAVACAPKARASLMKLVVARERAGRVAVQHLARPS